MDQPIQPIHDAAERGDFAALRRALASGVSPNVLGQYGQTLLHCVCVYPSNAEARLDCLHILLEAGANVNALDEDEKTPLHYAAECSHANVVAALIKAGADVNRVDTDNRRTRPSRRATSSEPLRRDRAQSLA